MRRGYRRMLDEAEAAVETLPVAEALSLHGDPDALFVDLRDPREQERDGMVPGAFRMPRGMLEFWVDPESPYHKPVLAEGRRVVFYCASGWRSVLAAQTAQEMGLPRVCHLGGGLAAWREAGGPVAPPQPGKG